jgi:alginate O-acetyltransferase complex protein AlgI
MLFNSYVFLLGFMPAVLLVTTLLRRSGPDYLVPFLSLASLAFYAYWDLRYVPLLMGSILFNYAVGSALTTSRPDARFKNWILAAGILANLMLLGYFKYAGFFAENLNSLLGAQIGVVRIALPLGISFFTFTQLEYLVDAWRGTSPEYRLGEYVLFVSFFPHLIAGPILCHREVIPQFKDGLRLWSDEAFATGFLFLALGLFKKTVIADSLAPWVHEAFAHAGTLTFIDAWAGAVAYALQLYFDFSGYSDMAVGLALMLGIKFPYNFNSPYKSLSIGEFWRRWHITLSNFLRDYLYIPLGGSRRGPARTTVNLFITMLLGGLWHGAGWTFILWGAWHGLLLSLNHAWRRTQHRLNPLAAWTATFVATVLGWVVFRSPSIEAAGQYLSSMAGLEGLTLPLKYSAALDWMRLPGVHYGHLTAISSARFELKLLVLAALVMFVVALPNTQELAKRMEPRPRWAAFAVGCFLIGFLMVGRVAPFLYYQF